MAVKLRATKLTAAVAGAWSALGMATFGAFSNQGFQDGSTSPLVFAAVMVAFLFAPLFIFVFGADADKAPVRRLPQVAVRGLCWMLGAAIVAAPLMPFLSWLKSQ